MQKYYGAQYRDMHTGIHNVIIFESIVMANEVLKDLHEFEELPDWYLNESQYVGYIEIDFRNPPEEYREGTLHIVNGDLGLPTGVPDVY